MNHPVDKPLATYYPEALRSDKTVCKMLSLVFHFVVVVLHYEGGDMVRIG